MHLETLLATCEISDFQFKFSSMITPKKTVSFTWSIFWLLIKSWIVWFARFWDGLNAMNLVFFKFNESLLTLICCRCFAFFLLHGRLILLLYVPFLYYIYCIFFSLINSWIRKKKFCSFDMLESGCLQFMLLMNHHHVDGVCLFRIYKTRQWFSLTHI